MRVSAIATIFAAGLAGCSTTPVTTTTARQIPSERVYQSAYVGPAVAAEDATVVFLRDSGLLGAGCSHDIYVDNVKVFAIRHGEQMTIHVPPGSHFFRLETGGGLCPNVATSKETTLAAGAHQVYRILTPSDYQLLLTRIE